MVVRGDDSMSNSHVVRMPDLSKLNIPEKQRLIRVRDEQIFQELKTQHRETKTVHIELGGKAFLIIKPCFSAVRQVRWCL